MRNIINRYKFEHTKAKFICYKPCTKFIGKGAKLEIKDGGKIDSLEKKYHTGGHQTTL